MVATAKAKTISVDFDGVIHAYSKGWNGGQIYDKPVTGAKDALKHLVNQGYHVVILTARFYPEFPHADEQFTAVKAWLMRHGFHEGKHYHRLTNNKPPAIAYIDDRALKFHNWTQTISALD